MSVKETPKTSGPPKIVKLEMGFKLAEGWVNNMSKAEDYEPTGTHMESRPSRLGLGTKVSRQTKVGPSNDPIERKLHAKLGAEKGKVARRAKESIQSRSRNFDDDANLGSRTNAFTKRKAPLPLTSAIPRNSLPSLPESFNWVDFITFVMKFIQIDDPNAKVTVGRNY